MFGWASSARSSTMGEDRAHGRATYRWHYDNGHGSILVILVGEIGLAVRAET
jgi:hypothetical protein